MLKMNWKLHFLTASVAHAALRFGCSTVSVQRLDPLVEPGANPSSHVHQIVGGNAFAPTMKGDIGEQANCTTCVYTEDFSNYWTAVMYFRHENGSYKRVPQYPNAQLGHNDTNIKGGMTIYYTEKDFSSDGDQYITGFAPGFRMTVGSPTVNNKTNGTNPGLAYTCLQSILTRGSETPDFPKKPCPAGIMAIHHFPACWDGKNLDSPDHQSHMFSTTRGHFLEAGPCPASHPVRVPQVAYETMWNTTAFADMWPSDGSQPFVWSFMGNGYGTHADYLFGWKGDSLQRAINDTCMFHGCGSPGVQGVLKTQTVEEMNKCEARTAVEEDVDGWLDELPGMNMGGVV
ncbi:uncharacterized protein CC84DRAFT_1251890 [Paraphaeosphaeria sporulosa]|uniref:DUF1996 domain-containing protein n=1 Tax=Paraphaeosphaeria sporulosa TaxID=1460663 RepID=A0A177C2B5_9PLEO|nr:uncharacterized protein CC84DRAFT_1251890 [Paraphaeosphaeria sporulosa]OAG01934.1 hypothetical protein CC84DRAFT_1251890 [Paraphaeosphaeria sporulosa]